MIVRLDGKEAIPIHRMVNPGGGSLPDEIEPEVYDNADTAATRAARFAREYGLVYQIRPIKGDENWREREAERFESGYYTKLPWHDENWTGRNHDCVDHFAHVGRSDPALVAFTIDEKKGRQGRKSALRPSRYLQRYYSEILTEASIREWAAKYKKLYDKDNLLKFAYTREDIKRVYLKGPQSCMSKHLIPSGLHPSEAYSGPDLAVAYAEKNLRILARALCWPEKHIYSRIYGDAELLGGLLDDEGFEYRWTRDLSDQSFVGARLTRIMHGKRVICPYIDGYQRVRLSKSWLTINPNGKLFCQNQDGYGGQPFVCQQCRTVHEMGKTITHNVGGRMWCDECFQKQKDQLGHCQWLIENEGQRYANYWYNIRDLVRMYDGQFWHRNYGHNEGYAFKCDDCKLRYPMKMASKNKLHRKFSEFSGYNVPNKCHDCASKQGELSV